MKRSLRTGPLLVLASVGFSGCYASNVVEADQREVKVKEEQVTWRPASEADLPGFYESTAVEGAAAGALLKAYYYFGPEGDYSGGVLAVSPEGPRFLVLAEDGRYSFSEGKIDLQDGSGPVPLEAAPGQLRLTSPETTLVFRRGSCVKSS